MSPLHAFQCDHRPLLVLLSYSISVLGSLAALQWAQQLLRLPSRRQLAGILGPAVALGGAGVWSMHFIAMTACRLPFGVSYDPALTAASLILAVAVTGAGLYVVASSPASAPRLLAGGSFTGLGIAAMHYTGMAAMRLPARITREVHDEVGQTLTALRLDLGWLRQQLGSSPPAAAGEQVTAKLRSMNQLLDGTMEAVQRIMAERRPGILDQLGLEAAIDWYVSEFRQRTGIACRFRTALSGATLDAGTSTVLFRILQEALTNAVRHAAATAIDVRLESDGRTRVVLTVADDGVGIPADRIDDPRSLGLLGMRERARALGGEVPIHANPDHGTTVEAVLPLRPAA